MSAEIELFCEEGASLAIDEAELARVFDLVLAEEGVERACCVSVSVLGERPDDPDLGPDEPCELGDIAMAPSVLAAQSARFGTTPEDETRLMAIHSLLHLLGYDHIEEADAAVMEAREDELLALACGRDLGHVATTRHADDTPLPKAGERP